jgi:glycosyltransferase involved in cell wall biosynthesis
LSDALDHPWRPSQGNGRSAAPVGISVALPVLNDARWLGRAIESVLAQTYPNWELVISDNASTDDLAAIVAGYDDDPRIRYHRWPRRVNASEWVQVLSADDRLQSSCLERLADASSRSHRRAVAWPWWLRVVDGWTPADNRRTLRATTPSATGRSPSSLCTMAPTTPRAGCG